MTADVYISTTKYIICKITAIVKDNTADLIDLCRLKNFKLLILEISIIRRKLHVENQIRHSLFAQTC